MSRALARRYRRDTSLNSCNSDASGMQESCKGIPMRNKLWMVIATAVATLTLAWPTLAHHGVAAYDNAKTASVAGTVTDFSFENPHAMATVETKDDKGRAEKWEGELTSPNNLVRSGWWRMSLKPGDRITMSGNPAKTGATYMWVRRITLSDGKDLPIPMGGDI